MSEIPFQNLLDALLDEGNLFHPSNLHQLSDLEPSEIATLADIWKDIPIWRRQALLEDLEELRASDTILSFEAIGRHAIGDDDPKVRSLAISILDEYEARDLIDQFLNILTTDSDPDARAASALALGKYVFLGELDELPAKTLRGIEDSLLETIDNDPTKVVSRRALEAVSYSSRPEIPKLIENGFASGDKEWMCSALFAMGRSVDKRWSEHITSVLEHKAPTIRAAAAHAAGELELNEAVPFLLDLVDDIDQGVRTASIWSLSQIGGDGVRESFEWLLEEAEDNTEIEILEAAIDNLAFTEDFEMFSSFGFPREEFQTSVSELSVLEDDEEFLGNTTHNNDE